MSTWSATSGNREVIWQLPVCNRIHSILKNPVYAGAFVRGRRRTRTSVVDGGARKTQGHDVPLAQWEVVIHDHHDAYIDWETFLANHGQIQTNIGERGRVGAGHGAAKAGWMTWKRNRSKSVNRNGSDCSNSDRTCVDCGSIQRRRLH